MHLLTAKPTFYIGNVDEGSLGKLGDNKHYQALKRRAEAEGALLVPICAALEAQIAEPRSRRPPRVPSRARA